MGPWHYLYRILLETFRCLHFLNGRWNRYTDGLENLATGAQTLAANGDAAPAVFLDHRLLQGPKILLDIGPLENVAGFFQSAVQLFSEQQRQKAAEHISSDGLIPLVEDGPCFKKALHIPEGPLNLPELFVPESNLGGRKLGVCSEYPLAVKAGIFFDLFQIDTDALALDLDVLAVTFVAYKTFRTPFDLLSEGLNDCLPVCGIFLSLLGVEAHNVAPVLYHDLLDLERRRVFGAGAFGNNHLIPSRPGEDLFGDRNVSEKRDPAIMRLCNP